MSECSSSIKITTTSQTHRKKFTHLGKSTGSGVFCCCLYFFVQIAYYLCPMKTNVFQPQRNDPDPEYFRDDRQDESLSTIEKTVLSEYKYGFVTDIEADEAPKGLNEDIIRFISAKKN